MAEEQYSAKKVELRKRDYQAGRHGSVFMQPADWLFETKRPIQKHIKTLVEDVERLLATYIPGQRKKLNNLKEVPIPVIIQMQDTKLAKTHRPDKLLDEAGSEIISIQTFGKLIISSTEYNLEKMLEVMNAICDVVPDNRADWIYSKIDNSGKKYDDIKPAHRKEYELIHELTSIKKIMPYTSEEVLSEFTGEQENYASIDGEVKIRFFNYINSEIENTLVANFVKEFQSNGIRRSKVTKLLNYSKMLNTYVVPYISKEVLTEMASFPGVEYITSFLRFESNVAPKSGTSKTVDIIYPNKNNRYPKVALVDSGISSRNNYLTPWISDQEIFISENNQSNYHAEFIGGLLIYGHMINDRLSNVVDSGFKILDIVVMADPSKEIVREDDLLNALTDALEIYSEEYKVWNLSLGTSCLCNGAISDFTAAIDELQDIYNVIFVISSGNYNEMRDYWPVNDMFESEEDRICLPADSIRAITVGAIAIDHDSDAIVQASDITPYSRRGPGIGLTVKPEVVHYSGNPQNCPILSLDSKGKVIGDFGTSYSAPLVSGILAEYFEMYPSDLSPLLARALLVHGARHPITNKRIDTINDHYYFGFGLPKRLHKILNGDEHEITLVFEGRLNYQEGINWINITDFPFPPSLTEGEKINGNILVTLAYQPHLNPNLGSEYCRSNVDIKLRSQVDDEYKTITKGCASNELEFEEKWEKKLMMKELKWSPIKQVEFNSPRGSKGTKKVSLELFPTWRQISEKQEIPFAIVVTIRDPKKQASVYKDVSRLLIESYTSTDLRLRYTPTRMINR